MRRDISCLGRRRRRQRGGSRSEPKKKTKEEEGEWNGPKLEVEEAENDNVPTRPPTVQKRREINVMHEEYNCSHRSVAYRPSLRTCES
jgi:hypothetical protein